MDYNNLLNKLLSFRRDRDWEMFHDPKNLSMALSIEADELMEHFLWIDKDQIKKFDIDKMQKISEEVADVFIYLAYLSHGLNIDIEKAVERKLVM